MVRTAKPTPAKGDTDAAPVDPRSGQQLRSPLQRRRRFLLLAAAFALLASIVGVVSARFIQSPAEVAARTAPPPLTTLTAPVRRAVLTATITTRGTVQSDGMIAATPTSMVGASLLVITAVKTSVGSLVRPGSVVAEVSGRPIIALPGALPAWRDLRLGDQGRDVLQLQKALESLGYLRPTGSTAHFDSVTEAAVSSLYHAIGYPASSQTAGTLVPMSEVLYVPAFPARVSQLDAALGQILSGPAISLSYGPLTTTAQLQPSNAALVKVGLPAVLNSEVLGQSAHAAVSGIGALTTSSTGSSGGGAYLPVRLTTSRPLPPEWLGQDVEVTITAARTPGPVTLVPVSAVSTTATGSANVSVQDAGKVRVIAVNTGASADGYIQVAPMPDQPPLTPGQQVIVGTRGQPGS